MSIPVRPYRDVDGSPTSGWSGSETSAQRAREADSSGKTATRQKQAIEMLEWMNVYGMTWKDFAEKKGLHHGVASGTLSQLHKGGKIERLAQTRNNCKIYVLPQYVMDRATEPHGKKSKPAPKYEPEVITLSMLTGLSKKTCQELREKGWTYNRHSNSLMRGMDEMQNSEGVSS